MTNPLIHLIVEEGPDKGREVTLPPSGARMGRSSESDVSLADPLLSRQHCRFEFRPDGALWVADLASANQTLVNDTAVDEHSLVKGDRVTIGDTVLRVIATTADGTDAAAPHPATEAPIVDLGLTPEPRKDTVSGISRPKVSPQILTVAAAVLLLSLAALGFHIFKPAKSSTPTLKPLPPAARTLELVYEKVEGSTDNIFRYALVLDAGQDISIQLDDLEHDRHVRKEARVQTNLIQELIRDIEISGFFDLDPMYEGYQTDAYVLWDLTVVIGKRAHRVSVNNRVEPEAFRAIRARIETFGRNELGLWAIPFSRDTLIAKAHEEYLLGKKRYDERRIEYGNLAKTIRHFQEAEIYLETVNPKPDFYADGVTSVRRAKEELQQQYVEQSYRADRAIRLKDWEQAATQLRILCELVPNESDERHAEAKRKLIDVEMRLKTGR